MNIAQSMRDHRKAIVIGVLAVLVVGGAVVYWRAGREAEPAYREVVVTRGDLEVTILSTGMVQPQNRLEIKAPIPGRAEEVLVVEGQTVAKGRILAWMSPTERAALIDAARAQGPEELKRWEELYRATPILAPIGGTVILRNIEPGQTFTVNDAVFVMSDRLTVKAQVDETDIAQIRLRQKARVVLDAYPDRPIAGQVEKIAYDAKTVSNVTTYEVEVLPDQIPAFMRSGMTVNVSFTVATRRGVLLAPSDAVRSRDGRAYVLPAPAKKGAAPVEREIRAGMSDGRHIEVLEGVTEGERLLAKRLRTGASGETSSPLMPFGGRR